MDYVELATNAKATLAESKNKKSGGNERNRLSLTERKHQLCFMLILFTVQFCHCVPQSRAAL